MRPVALDRSHGDAEMLGDFGARHSREKAQRDHLRRRGLQQLVEGDRMRAAAALLPLLMPAVVHEQPAHRLRSKRQSMRAPLPWPSAFILEAEPRFVYERC